MADFDVGVTGLQSPPISAVLKQYRPAVQVRNNGLHNAIASGYVRIYAAGLLIFESEVYSGTLVPGASGTADAVDYWTPEHEGTYIVQGYLTTPLDQVEPNNNLSPVTVIVTGEEPPEPPTVPLHAAQHEEGGTDPINVDGLPGVLADRQLPSAHGTQHQAGQSDVLNLSGLAGILSDPQTPAAHGNEKHDPDMATSAELTTHQNAMAVHTAAENLANRETSGPDDGLVIATQLAGGTEDPADNREALLKSRLWGYPIPFTHAASHAPAGSDPLQTPGVTSDARQSIICTPAGGAATLATLELTSSQAKPGTSGTFDIVGTATTAAGVGQSVVFTLYHQSGAGTTAVCAATFPLAGGKNWTWHLSASAGIRTGNAIAGLISGEITDTSVAASESHADAGAAAGLVAPVATSRFFMSVAWTGGAPASTLTASNAIALGVSLP